MRARVALGAGALASLLFASGCTSSPRFVSGEELDSQQRRILELEREVARARAEAESLRGRVAELEAARVEPPPPIPASPSGPGSGEPVAPAPEDAPAAPPAPLPSAIEESDLTESEPSPAGDAYEAGLTAFREGRYEEAERLLAGFASGSPSSDLADNAWFWVGECRLARNDARGAIDAYRTTIERYPEGNKVPDTMLKLGIALEAAGDREGARESWSELLRRFPTTAAAEAARLRLEAP